MKTIVDLRRKRVPIVEIAATFGISPARVSQLYSQALREIPAPAIAEHRAEELSLADDAVRSLLKITIDDSVSPRTRVEAWSSIRSWAEHKARMLGLNAAVKVEVSDAVDAELERLAQRLGIMEPAGEAEAARHAQTS